MKKLIFLVFFVFIFFDSTFAQQRKQYTKLPSFILKAQPQNLIRNGLKFGAEIFAAKHKLSHEVMLEPIYASYQSFNDADFIGKKQVTGFAFEYTYKLYLNGGLVIKKNLTSEKVQGTYVGLSGGIGSYTQTNGVEVYSTRTSFTIEDVNLKSTNFNLSLVGGYQKEVMKNVYLEIYLGAGIQQANTSISPNIISAADATNKLEEDFGFFDSGLFPKGGLKVGFGF